MPKITAPPPRHNPKNGFQHWLLQQYDRGDNVGDLAKFAVVARDFPPIVRGIGDLFNYLDAKRCMPKTKSAAVAAWREWMANR